jgi:hypothetical protein
MVVPDPTLAWDTGAPAAGLQDVGTPNQAFGGPGIGAGGEAGQPGENAVALHNALLSGEGEYTWWLLTFTSSTCAHSIDLVDIDADELPAQVVLFDVNLQTIATFESLALGDNSVETLDLGGTCGVFAMLIDFYGDGAWDDLSVCVDPAGGPEVCDDAMDNDGDGLVDEGCEPEDDDDCDWDWDWDCSVGGGRASPLALLTLLCALAGLTKRRRP